MKKIFFIFIFSTLSFALGALVFAQNLDDYPAPTPNTPNNDQALRNLMGDAYVDSCAVAESTATIDPMTGQRNDAANATCNDSKSDGIYFSPNVSMPGFAAVGQKIKITPDSIGLYINAVYKYGAGFAGIVAMFMIVFASWQWIIAAGNSGKIENAKDTIIGALIGLALLFGGYLLLNQISSKLVDLGSLDITHIKTRSIDSQQQYQTGFPTGQCLEEASQPYATCGVQFQSRVDATLWCSMGLSCTAGYMCWIQDLSNIGSWYVCSQDAYNQYGSACQCKKTDDFDMTSYPYRLKNQ